MGNQHNRIELNGKLYDAATGLPISDISAPKPTTTSVQTPVKKASHRSSPSAGAVDGFIRKPKTSSKPKAKHKPAKPVVHKNEDEKKVELTPHTKPVRAHQTKHARHHAPQKAKTLMRHVVAKPAHHHEQSGAPAIRTGVHPSRLDRARSVQKSQAIKKFGHTAADHHHEEAVKPKHQPLAVKQAPKKAHPEHHQPTTSAAVTHAAPVQTASQAVVARALQNAHTHEAAKQAHKQPRKRRTHILGMHRRTANTLTAVFAVLLLGGFFLYQNIPNLSVRLAANRAGFNAQLPGYQPSGFALNGPVQYGPGRVTVSFKSNSDERAYSLTQQVSNWNSQALVDNFMVANDKQYQTFEQQGKTVYLYDGSNATWVNGGVWYRIEGDSSLNSDQLLNIANSI